MSADTVAAPKSPVDHGQWMIRLAILILVGLFSALGFQVIAPGSAVAPVAAADTDTDRAATSTDTDAADTDKQRAAAPVALPAS